jgi:hypothetical protein
MKPQVASVPVLWTPLRTDYREAETGRARVLTVDEKQRKGTKTKGEEWWSVRGALGRGEGECDCDEVFVGGILWGSIWMVGDFVG